MQALTRAQTERSGEVYAEVWEDVATVTVPARSHRRTAIAVACAAASTEVKAGMKFRVLDEAAAETFEAREKAPVTPTMEFV